MLTGLYISIFVLLTRIVNNQAFWSTNCNKMIRSWHWTRFNSRSSWLISTKLRLFFLPPLSTFHFKGIQAAICSKSSYWSVAHLSKSNEFYSFRQNCFLFWHKNFSKAFLSLLAILFKASTVAIFAHYSSLKTIN